MISFPGSTGRDDYSQCCAFVTPGSGWALSHRRAEVRLKNCLHQAKRPNDNPSDVAVVIPSLNSPVIRTVIECVRAQYPDGDAVDLIVVGLDDTCQVDPRQARFISTVAPVRAARARNIGARATTAPILVFLDADCLPEDGWLATLLSVLDRGRTIVSGAVHLVPDDYLRHSGNVAAFHELTSEIPSGERQFLASFSLALTRAAYDEVGGFDESFSRGEDLDLTIRLRLMGYRLWFQSTARVVHRPNRTNLASIWRDGFESGHGSSFVRRRYPRSFGLLGGLFPWQCLIISAPILTLAAATRAFIRNRDVRGNPKAIPILLLSRFAWSRLLRHRDAGLPGRP